jgi:integrase
MNTTTPVRVKHEPARKQPWIVIYQRKGEGNKGRKKKSFATEADAQLYARRLLKAIATVPPLGVDAPTVPPGTVTYETFARDWLHTVVGRRKPATQVSYESLMRNHILPTLGPVPLADETMTVDAVARMLADCRDRGIEWGTQKSVLGVLGSSLSWALRTRKIKVNPCSGLSRSFRDDSADYVEPEPNPMTRDQMDAFLHWLLTGTVAGRKGIDGPQRSRISGGGMRSQGFPEWHPYFLTLFRTGMRQGEAAALQWTDLDLDAAMPSAWLKRNYSAARAALSKGYQQGDGTLKTNRPHRVDLSAGVVDVLRRLRATRQADALREGKRLSPYVFLTLRGKRVLPSGSTAKRIFAKACAAIGAQSQGHTMHDTRDTFATTHLSAGTPLLWVSAMLGHSQPSTTLNRYSKWVRDEAGVSYAAAFEQPTRSSAFGG